MEQTPDTYELVVYRESVSNVMSTQAQLAEPHKNPRFHRDLL